jgi:pyruvate dehydrogenase E2 component (dihydrolipoamide acetyltransferase)
MATIVRMPSVLAGAEEATIANWLIAEGDSVAIGDAIAEIETEKALVEYAAEQEGTVGRLVLEPGMTGAVGAPIAVLLGAGEGPADVDAVLGSEGVPAESDAAEEPAETAVSSPAPALRSAPAAATIVTASPNPAAPDSPQRFASPIARKLAAERGLDLATVTGTGPGGRITRRDVEAASRSAASAIAASASAADAVIPAPAGRLVPHTPMRRAIARRLTESKATVPHFYLLAECRVDELLALRTRLNATLSRKVSVNDFVIKAAAGAFEAVPEANVTWTDDGMVVHDTVDISVAVATDGGLTTPVVRDVGARSLSNISAAVADLAGRARDKRLRQDELDGGSFSVSNLGMYGTVEFSAILNPPQWGILAVGAATKQAVVVDDALVVATVMRCVLSVDHRAVDGALGARWLAALKERIENPLTILA